MTDPRGPPDPGPVLADGPRRHRPVDRRLVPRAAALDVARLRRPRPRPGLAARAGGRVLPVRRAQGPAAAHRDRDPGLVPALVRLAREGAQRARGPERRGRDGRGRRVRDRHAVLLVLGRAAVHRLPRGRRARSASRSRSWSPPRWSTRSRSSCSGASWDRSSRSPTSSRGWSSRCSPGCSSAASAWSGMSRTTSGRSAPARVVDQRQADARGPHARRLALDARHRGAGLALRDGRHRHRRRHPRLRADRARRPDRRPGQPARGAGARRARRAALLQRRRHDPDHRGPPRARACRWARRSRS